MVDRGLLHEVGGFRSVRRHVDAQLIAAVRAAGGATYRTHGLGYVLRRTDSGHTWQADLDDLRARAAADVARLLARTAHGALTPSGPRSRAMRLRTGLAVLPLVLVPLVACAPRTTTAAAAPTTPARRAHRASPRVERPDRRATTPAACRPSARPTSSRSTTPGQLTIGTDSPAYEPWFVDDDPTNGKGYESAVAYAVAEQLGFTPDQVTWVEVPFNTSYKPGDKDFDFDINQISITPARAEVVDFSDGYYAGRAGRDRAQGLAGRGGDDASPTSPTTTSAPRPAPRR